MGKPLSISLHHPLGGEGASAASPSTVASEEEAALMPSVRSFEAQIDPNGWINKGYYTGESDLK